MGAWGIGNFENDEAADWLYELRQSVEPGRLYAALAPITAAEDYLDAGDCAIALAAAEVIAALIGRPAPDLPLEASEWIKDQPVSDMTKTISIARQAVILIAAGSELRELFEETEELTAWLALLDDLLLRLTVGD